MVLNMGIVFNAHVRICDTKWYKKISSAKLKGRTNQDSKSQEAMYYLNIYHIVLKFIYQSEK